MTRIAAAEIERLKEEVSVERLVEAAGVELKRRGHDLVGHCPFHDDSTASLVITPSKNLWHCFGCGLGGGPIDWMIQKNGVSFRHAVELLREGLPTLAAEPVKRSSVRALPPPVAFDADDQTLLDQTVDYYHRRLLDTVDAKAYLQSRGLNHPDLITTFKLGVADRTLGLRLPDKRRVAGADIRARLTRIGLYRDSGHEHFNGSLIVPIFDEHGHVTEVYGRKLLDNLRAGTPKHLYLPAHAGRNRGVFNLEALKSSREIILCEALIDALTFWDAGYRNVTSIYGTEGFTADHLTAFKHYGVQCLLIAFDRDDAGERAAEKIVPSLIEAGIECFRIQFPKGMDTNSYAQKLHPAEKSLGLAIRQAQWLGGKRPVTVHSPEETEAGNTTETAPLEPLPSPSSLAADPVACVVKEHDITLNLGDRHYRVRGLNKNLSFELLKVNLMVTQGERFYLDTVDLYSAKQRQAYTVQAALELQIDGDHLKADLGSVLMQLETLQEQNLQKVLAPLEASPKMSDGERQTALALLKSPDLVDHILADLERCGLIGETANKLVAYLASVSRKRDRPLGVVIQSSSAAGKSSLLDAVLAFVPEEDRVKYSAMTGQSLFYIGETNLKHKVLAIVEEEGASRASYALKLLQSEGELTIASTGKDPATGNLVTQQYRVEGPVALLLTTTARDIDEELMNRCLVLSVDEGRDQTRAIHQRQRDQRTLEGLLARKSRDATVTLHQNLQRLLTPIDILNPYVQYLTFPDQTTRLRRDHEKYLTLIDTIAFLHQHQRPKKQYRLADKVLDYIEVTLDDIALANRLAHDVLGRSLDELPPQTRKLLVLIDGYVNHEMQRRQVRRSEIRFSRRQLREAIVWGDTQLKIHLARLVELEYLLVHKNRQGGFDYELIYGVSPEKSLRFPGLVDVETLRWSEQQPPQSAGGRALVGGKSVRGSVITNLVTALPEPDSLSPNTSSEKTEHQDESQPSYPHAVMDAEQAVPSLAVG